MNPAHSALPTFTGSLGTINTMSSAMTSVSGPASKAFSPACSRARMACSDC
jgi:hypothetical protein